VGTWHGVELGGVELRGYGLRLRPLEERDATAVAAGMTDPAMQTHWLPVPQPYTRADAETFLAGAGSPADAGTGLQLAIALDGATEIVGAVNLRLPGPDAVRAEIGYSVYPAGQGRGFAASASRLLARWSFDHGVASVLIRCSVANLASAKTALNAGFRYEGTARDEQPLPHPLGDAAQFGRTRTDAEAAVARAFVALPAGGLTDGTIRLRAVGLEDTSAWIDDHDNPEQRRWAFHDHGPTTTEEAQRRVVDAALAWLVGGAATMAIVEAGTGETAGFLTLRKAGPPAVGGIGYSVRPAFRGRGFTARALRLVRAWALTNGGFHRLELGANADNVASQRAALSGGFQPDGVRTERLRNPDGSFSDEVRFVSLRPQD
jgi:RimJ/RimL family protein N-acetyltransferase